MHVIIYFFFSLVICPAGKERPDYEAEEQRLGYFLIKIKISLKCLNYMEVRFVACYKSKPEMSLSS